jgi:MSHA pilin protein MshD
MSTDAPPIRCRARARRAGRGQRGFTLPEAILAIVVLGVGLAGVLLAFATVARGSGDPMLRQQMLAIAEGMMAEIQLKPYASAANAAPGGCARDSFNDIGDYDGYTSSGICTVDGVLISALAGYQVAVVVQAATLGGVAAARRISVTASHDGESLQLVGWRTDFASP